MWELGTVVGLLGLSFFFGGLSLFLPRGKYFWRIVRFIFFWTSIICALLLMAVVNLIAKDFSTNVSSIVSNALILMIVAASTLFLLTFAFMFVDIVRMVRDSFKEKKEGYMADDFDEQEVNVINEEGNFY